MIRNFFEAYGNSFNSTAYNKYVKHAKEDRYSNNPQIAQNASLGNQADTRTPKRYH